MINSAKQILVTGSSGSIGSEAGVHFANPTMQNASKVAADVMGQDFGRNFNLTTCCLCGGSLVGTNHSGFRIHGFLICLVKHDPGGREVQ